MDKRPRRWEQTPRDVMVGWIILRLTRIEVGVESPGVV